MVGGIDHTKHWSFGPNRNRSNPENTRTEVTETNYATTARKTLSANKINRPRTASWRPRLTLRSPEESDTNTKEHALRRLRINDEELDSCQRADGSERTEIDSFSWFHHTSVELPSSDNKSEQNARKQSRTRETREGCLLRYHVFSSPLSNQRTHERAGTQKIAPSHSHPSV